MVNISQTYGGKPVFWIRYNPDSFKLPDGTPSTITDSQREAHLLEWVTFAHQYIPKEYVEVIYLFYDGCSNDDYACFKVGTRKLDFLGMRILLSNVMERLK